MPTVGPAWMYSALTLPEHLTTRMPSPIEAAWSEYTAVADRWQNAKQQATELRAAAHTAPAADQAAALKAAAAGKAVPPATQEKAREKAEAAKRETDALATLALKAEAVFLATVEDHRSSWRDLLHRDALSDQAEAVDLVAAAEVAISQAQATFSAWAWLSFTSDLHSTPGSTGAVTLTEAHKILAEIDPAALTARVAADQAEAEENARLWKLRGI